jgi:hypothetical protein
MLATAEHSNAVEMADLLTGAGMPPFHVANPVHQTKFAFLGTRFWQRMLNRMALS